MNRAERRKKNNGDIIKREIKVKVDLAIDMMLICLKISMREHRISEERIENIVLRANEILMKKYKVDGKSEWERCQANMWMLKYSKTILRRIYTSKWAN